MHGAGSHISVMSLLINVDMHSRLKFWGYICQSCFYWFMYMCTSDKKNAGWHLSDTALVLDIGKHSGLKSVGLYFGQLRIAVEIARHRTMLIFNCFLD